MRGRTHTVRIMADPRQNTSLEYILQPKMCPRSVHAVRERDIMWMRDEHMSYTLHKF
jgi:hypothetical protein